VLPTFSKPLEWSFMIRLVHFFETNGLLPASQHGFIKGRCTDTALFQFFVGLHKSMEGRSKVLGIFYDLTNAFGSVCVPLILQKFEHLGVRGIPLQWLRSSRLTLTELTLTEFSSLDIGRMEIDRIISLMHRTDIDRMHNDPFRY
jgi:hypothetical protein